MSDASESRVASSTDLIAEPGRRRIATSVVVVGKSETSVPASFTSCKTAGIPLCASAPMRMFTHGVR